MADDHVSVTLIGSAYDAFARGDIPTVLEVLAQDILWHVPGRGPLSRVSTTATPRFSGSSSASWGYPKGHFGSSSTTCSPRVIA